MNGFDLLSSRAQEEVCCAIEKLKVGVSFPMRRAPRESIFFFHRRGKGEKAFFSGRVQGEENSLYEIALYKKFQREEFIIY